MRITSTEKKEATIEPQSGMKTGIGLPGLHHTARWIFTGLFYFLSMVLSKTSPAQVSIRPSLADSIRVESLEVTGNRMFDTRSILESMETKESPGSIAVFLWKISERFPFSAEPTFFDDELFRKDIETIRSMYRNIGYFDAAVTGSYEWTKDSSGFNVALTIDEGSPVFVDSIAYVNLDLLPEDVREKVFTNSHLLRTKRYLAADLQDELTRIRTILANNGYPRSYFDSVQVLRKMSNGNVVLRIPFFFGRRLTFGPIDEQLQGVDELNLARKIIYDRLEFETGDIYSSEKREKAEVALNRLGIFSSVQLAPNIPEITDTINTSVPLTLYLEPKKRHELAPGLLLNNQFGRLNAGAETTYLFRNVFGGAQSFTARIDYVGKLPRMFDAFQVSAQVRLDQPYLVDNMTSGYWAVSYVIAQEEGLYDGNIVQSVIGAARDLEDRMRLSAEWTVEQSQYRSVSGSLVNTPFAFFDTTGIDYRNSILSLSFERDHTNDFFHPISGQSIRLTVEEAGLLKNLFGSVFTGFQSTEYYKAEALFRFFADASRNATSIVGFKFKSGGIFRYGESKDKDIPVPFNRRYYAGGSSSIRGWSARKLSVAGEEQANFGSNALIESSVEYRWQMFPGAKKWLAVEPDRLWLVLFADAGNLWREPGTIRVNEIAAAFGFGLRYNLFFGPIRIDYGMRAYDPALATGWFYEKKFFPEVFSKGVIHLGIGHAF